jgi:hypothetical protein
MRQQASNRLKDQTIIPSDLHWWHKLRVKVITMLFAVIEFFHRAPEHFVALNIGLIMLCFPIGFGFLIPWLDPMLSFFNLALSEPTKWHALPHFYILLIILIFFFSALDFWLARIRVSFPLVLILGVFIGFNLLQIDHYYYINPIAMQIDQTLNPIDVAKTKGTRQNLVVVASTGGGIWASGWTIKAIQELITARPELLQEIRLLSTVSGGSVGAAYFIHDLCHNQKDLLSLNTDRQKFLRQVYDKAVTSSLSTVAYGFTYFDSFRLLSGGLLSPFINTDRALLQEQRWQSVAAAGQEADNDPNKDYCDDLLALRNDIRAGRIPAPIFNTTAMESGRRIMITPINFDILGLIKRTQIDPALESFSGDETRADTLSELLFKPANSSRDQPLQTEAEMSLWTAARLSAAFPYVTPAARARLASGASGGDFAENDLKYLGRKYHLIDGGYYDNFGIASALEWLQPVLEARVRREEGLLFKKIAIIELRAFPLQARTCYQPEQGASSAILGPVVGLYNIRTGSAFSRNEIELARFIESWNKRLRPFRVQIERFIFEPKFETDENGCKKEQELGPLSWLLTQKDIENLDNEWKITTTATSDNKDELSRLKNFLAP